MIGRGNTDKMKYYMPCLGDDELSHKAPQSQTTRKDDWYLQYGDPLSSACRQIQSEEKWLEMNLDIFHLISVTFDAAFVIF